MKELWALKGELDQIFRRFYDEMLSKEEFSLFFSGDAQIRDLIVKLKSYVLSSLTMPENELKRVYVTFGEKHHDMRLCACPSSISRPG